MQLFVCTAAILAVTVIYFFWRSYDEARQRRRRALRERVAFMLWMAAEVAEDDEVLESTCRDRLTIHPV
jgi:hypothetical protein